MVKNDNLHRLLHGSCDFPDCICGGKWRGYEETFRQWDRAQPTPDQLVWAKLDITIMLHCVAAHCPDKGAKRHAMVQLLNPIFNIDEPCYADRLCDAKSALDRSERAKKLRGGK